MTLQSIYDTIRDYAMNTKGVESFTIGDPYVTWNAKNMTYGAFNAYLNYIQCEDNANYRLYNFTFYFGDKLTNNSSNLYEVQDEGVKVIENVIRHLREDFYYNEDYNVQIRLFTQAFADILAGAYADVNIIIPIDDQCENYDKE